MRARESSQAGVSAGKKNTATSKNCPRPCRRRRACYDPQAGGAAENLKFK